MLRANETHEKIINLLRIIGPSLPIQLSKQIGMSSLFISAFLSELTNEKKIKTSSLKVGGSPLYYLEGQEEQLEKFYAHLHPKEAETFLLLKKEGILKDEEQEPATRVALRSIRDFAIGFKQGEEIFWRYILIPESEINERLNSQTKQKNPPKPKPAKIEIETPPQVKESKPIQIPEHKTVSKEKSKPVKKEIKEENFENPLVINTKKPSKEKIKSEFAIKIIDILKRNEINLLEEINFKNKEYNCIVQIDSDLGPINFLTQAKNKKTISETDLKKLLSIAQSRPLPAFMIYTGELSKKAKEYVEKYYSILKTKKIIEK